MNNDYERYEFWHREMSQINKEKSVDYATGKNSWFKVSDDMSMLLEQEPEINEVEK